MPRIFEPEAGESLQPRMIVPQMDERAAGSASGAAADFFLRASGVFADIEQARVRAEAASAETLGRTRMTTGMAELRRTLAEGDPATIPDRWRAGVTALREQIAGEVPEAQRGRVGRLTDQMAADALAGVIELQTRRTGDEGRATLLRSLDDLVRAGAAAADPEERAGTVGQIEAAVQAAVRGGLIGAEAGERLLQGARRRVDREMARAMVRGRGPGAVDTLPLPPMPPEDMAALREEATADMIAAGVEAEQFEQEVVSTRERVVAETVSRALAGEPVPAEDVMALRWDMPPARYEAVMTLVRGGAARRDDTDEVAALTRDAGWTGTASYRARLDNALSAGMLTPETHRRLGDLDASLRSDAPEARARREAREQIVQELQDAGEVEGVGVPAGLFRGIPARALDMWEGWQAANPQASPQERQEMHRFVIGAAREKVVRDAIRVLPRPGGLRIEAGQPPRMADLDKLEDDLLAAFDQVQGSMDAGDAALASGIVDELALIERWRIVVDMAEQMRAAAGTQRGQR